MKYFDSGSYKLSFSIAVNEWDSKAKEATTTWVKCEAWNKTAQFVADNFKKGKPIGVSGRYAVNKWTNDQGEEKKKHFFVLQEAFFLPGEPSEPKD